jgi:hypothetical protein
VRCWDADALGAFAERGGEGNCCVGGELREVSGAVLRAFGGWRGWIRGGALGTGLGTWSLCRMVSWHVCGSRVRSPSP